MLNPSYALRAVENHIALRAHWLNLAAMNHALVFDRSFSGQYGMVEWLSPRLRRITARNPGFTTFVGTNTYIVGTGHVAVVDPGPDSDEHLSALRTALRGEKVTHILITHSHKDHCALLPRLKDVTGAPVYAEGPYRPALPWSAGNLEPLEAADVHFNPDYALGDGEKLSGSGWTLQAIATPGHTANHMAFALLEDQALLSGDHIMAWSTSIIAPPDGAMQPYLESLKKIAAREWQIVWPGHGGPVRDPAPFIAAYLDHRLQREAQIIDALSACALTIPALVERIYAHLDAAHHGAAALSVFAHLEDLVARGIVAVKPRLAFDALYAGNQRSFGF